jgi:anaerobic dimethyl sulfoxide reductase subunit B (iron-sulfur subunit)
MCLVACPYGAPQFGAEDNPKMQKCDFCLEEWAQGKQPICVRSCTMRALDAGPIEELRAKYGDVREAEGFSYYEKSEPNIIFKPKA